MLIDRFTIEIHEVTAHTPSGLPSLFMWEVSDGEMWDTGEADTYEDALRAATKSARLRPHPGEVV